jgi:hypothetical protein
MTIIQDIESVVGEKGLITGKDVFNRKAGIWIDDGIRADAIVRPKDTLELSRVLAICNENKQAVIPWRTDWIGRRCHHSTRSNSNFF